MRRRELLLAVLGNILAAWPLAVAQQQRATLPRIGFLGVDTPAILAARVAAFQEGLRDLGYVEGKNLVVEFRYAQGDYTRLSGMIAELADLGVRLLVTQGSPATVAAKQATMTLPIVMTAVGDAVLQGIIDGLARPGGNITGVSFQSPEFTMKRLELLKEVDPRIKKVAVLANPKNSSTSILLNAMQVAASSAKVEFYEAPAQEAGELTQVFSTIVDQHADAIIVLDDPMTIANATSIATLAATYRLPCASFSEITEAGGLLAYGPNRLDMYRRAAYFVDRILKGARPADIPVELPAKFDLVINLKTAKALGLTIPQPLLATADEVIE